MGTQARKYIASPKLVPKLSPINTFVRGNINAAPLAQNALLKFAVNNKVGSIDDQHMTADDDE
jgi:hypothetical protein